MARPIDTRIMMEEDMIAFIEAEVKRLNTSGRAGYIAQLITAVRMAQRGDTSLLGAFTIQGAPQPPIPTTPISSNQTVIDRESKEMF